MLGAHIPVTWSNGSCERPSSCAKFLAGIKPARERGLGRFWLRLLPRRRRPCDCNPQAVPERAGGAGASDPKGLRGLVDTRNANVLTTPLNTYNAVAPCCTG